MCVSARHADDGADETAMHVRMAADIAEAAPEGSAF